LLKNRQVEKPTENLRKDSLRINGLPQNTEAYNRLQELLKDNPEIKSVNFN